MIVQIGSVKRIELNAVMMYQLIEGVNSTNKLEISFQNGREILLSGTKEEVEHWLRELDRVCGATKIEKVPSQDHYTSMKDTESTQQELLLS